MSVINYGFSTDASGKAVCAVKQWPETGSTVGYLLFCFGTEPDPLSVCPDSHMRCLRKSEAQLQAALDTLFGGNVQADHAYIAANLSDIIQRINSQIYDISAFLGQSICIGGGITVVVRDQFVTVPFGGGQVYQWTQEKQLKRIGDPNPNRCIAVNPIGSGSKWTGKYWTGKLQPGTRLLTVSCLLADDTITLDTIGQGSQPESHDDTAAILLRQLLEKQDLTPIGVLDLHF